MHCRFIFILPLTILPSIICHSWLECLDTNRTVVYDHSYKYIFGGEAALGLCKGYGRKYGGRPNDYTYQLFREEVEDGAPPCKYAKTEGDYGGDLNMLSVRPSQMVFYSYMPNGHVVKDHTGVGTPANLYWSGKAGVDLESTLELTPQNRLGRIRDFDDGHCGETYRGADGTAQKFKNRAGDYIPCIGNFSIPSGTTPGVYQIVWFWQRWKEDEEAKGFHVAYSTCFDVEVLIEDGGNSEGSDSGGSSSDSDEIPDIYDSKESAESADSAESSDRGEHKKDNKRESDEQRENDKKSMQRQNDEKKKNRELENDLNKTQEENTSLLLSTLDLELLADEYNNLGDELISKSVQEVIVLLLKNFLSRVSNETKSIAITAFEEVLEQAESLETDFA